MRQAGSTPCSSNALGAALQAATSSKFLMTIPNAENVPGESLQPAVQAVSKWKVSPFSALLQSNLKMERCPPPPKQEEFPNTPSLVSISSAPSSRPPQGVQGCRGPGRTGRSGKVAPAGGWEEEVGPPPFPRARFLFFPSLAPGPVPKPPPCCGTAAPPEDSRGPSTLPVPAASAAPQQGEQSAPASHPPPRLRGPGPRSRRPRPSAPPQPLGKGGGAISFLQLVSPSLYGSIQTAA